MVRFLLTGVAVLGMATAAAAGDYKAPGWRTNDKFLTPFGVRQALIGRSVEFINGSVARYHDNGSFDFQPYPGAELQIGRYSVSDTGAICARFDSGQTRCDTYVHSGRDLIALTGSGQRWKVKAAVPE